MRPFPPPAGGQSPEWQISRAGKPRPWCSQPTPALLRPNDNTWPFDLAPDGKRFVILPMPAGALETSAHITVLLNFFDELRRRVPVP